MARARGLTLAVAVAAVTLVAAPVSGAAAAVAPGDGGTNAYYSRYPSAPQSKSVAAFRHFLSSEQTQYDLQSFPFFGSLVDDAGRTNTFSLMMQQTNNILGSRLSYAVDGILFNQGKGYTAGGVQGIPEYTLPLSITEHPWSIRAQAFNLGKQPQFVDARVVEGNIGERGAVYEFTSNVTASRLDGSNKPYLLQVYVRAKDTLGMVQWGYGPNSFFPQWIYPTQRAAIMTRFHGSVGAYLAATGHSLSGQGDYYYSAPLLRVQEYALYANGHRFSHGRAGTIWLDNVVQSFDAAANKIIKNNVTWTEFSTQLPGLNKALKIGWVHQKSVGRLPYAMLVGRHSCRQINGNLQPSRWNIGSISITAAPGAEYQWKSKATGLSYHTKYTVRLSSRGNPHGYSANLTMTAVYGNQEVAFKGGRAVYEGLFRVSGYLNGQWVTGQAWGEVQPAGSL